MTTLSSLRAALAEVDANIVDLVAKRVRLSVQAGEAKRAAGAPIVHPAQERTVLERAASRAVAVGLNEREVRALFEQLIAMARNAQGAAEHGPPSDTARSSSDGAVPGSDR
jgi:chorismate mutase